MRVAIHQPHYFPWVGYFDKMAKADCFVLLDEVQFEKSSYMSRNRIVSPNGEPAYLSIQINKRGYCEKKYSEIQTVDNKKWKNKHLSMMREYYRKSRGYQELLPMITKFLEDDYSTVCEWAIKSIFLCRNILNITTPLVLQSEITYDRLNKKSDMDMEICKALGADVYFSGRGASLEYLNREKFAEYGIKIIFQDFHHPVYQQCNTVNFIPGISILDMLFNCGIEETRRVFWENVKSSHEFPEGGD